MVFLGWAVVIGAGFGAPAHAAPQPTSTPVAPLNGEGYVAVSPARLLDTRVGSSTVDGLEVGAGALGANSVLDLDVLGRGGVPATGVGSVVLHVTAVGQTEKTFITAYPKGIGWPGTSNLNPVPGVVASNLAIVPIGAGGKVSLFNSAGNVQLIVDVTGWFPVGPRFTAVTPARVADTRVLDTKVGAGQSLPVQVAGIAGVPTSGVSAVVLNVTTVMASTQTFLTVYPNGTPVPGTSNLNTQLANTAANLVVTPMGADGKVAVRNDAGTVHVIVDVLGWYAIGAGYTPVTPARVADTRSTTRLAADSSRVFQLTGLGGVPSAGVGSVIFNLTAVNHTAQTFLTVYPTGSSRPLSSSLNPHPGVVAPNLVIGKVGTDGSVTIYNERGTVDVIIDVVGWLPSNVVAGADSLTVTEDDPATGVAVLTNDTDLDGSPLKVKSVAQPAHGTAAVAAGGLSVTYRPDANYCNTPSNPADAFDYTLFGGATATVSVTVTCVDDSPMAVDDNATTNEDAPAMTLPVLANDTDLDGGPITVTAIVQPAQGTAVITGGGTGISYAPNTDFCSIPASMAEQIGYTLNGGATATVFVIVNCVDDPPVAVADSATVTEDDPATAIDVLANDTDVDGGPKTIIAVTQPAGGTVVITGVGTGLTYKPNANFCIASPGSNFTYTLNGGSVAQVSVMVTCVEDAPVAVADSVTLTEDASATAIDVLSNDTDVDAGPKTVVSKTDGAHGSVVITGGGTGVTYQPAADYCNTPAGPNDQFTYTLNGGSVGTVSITVTCVNDVPSFTKGADHAVVEDAGAQSVAGWATAISKGPANESAQNVAFDVTANTNAALFALAPAVSPSGTLTFTPTANASGTATITLTLSDSGGTAIGGVDTSAAQSFVITVSSVNDAPSFTKGAGQTVLEDAAGQSIAGWATAISGGPADESAQTLTFNLTGNTNPALFTAAPAVSPAGILTYTPTPNANGVATITLTLSDDGGTANGGLDTSAAQTFTISVTAVNDVPSFDLPASPDQSVLEGSAQQTVAAFAKNLSKGPANEAAQTLTLHVSNGNTGLFSVQPDIDEATGDLVYTPAAGATGTAVVSVHLTDDGGTANGGVDTSSTKTFDIVVFPPNFTPVAQGTSPSTLEDTAKVITLSATDGDDDNLTFSITGGPSHGTVGSIGAADCTTTLNTCTATVTYTPAANYNGADSFTFEVDDGTINSLPATINLTVVAVNDVPSFTVGANQTVSEDAAAQTIVGWATAIDKGATNEAGQSLTFNVTANTNPSLFGVGPAVSPSGTLTYTPAANASGAATITLNLSDDGGVANGGVDTTATQSFTITVTAVNDAPSFNTLAGNPTAVNEDAGVQTAAVFAAGMSAGPADESAQTLTFVVTANTNVTLFSTGPAISPTGTLTYTPAANRHGTATITVKLQDNGGVMNGGSDSSMTQQFTITVNAVNDVPTSLGRDYGTASLQSNMQRSLLANEGLLFGAADAEDVAGNAGYTPALSLGTVNGAAPVAGTITTTISGVGTVVADAATGAFTIDPAPGVSGAVQFNFTVCDTGEGSPGTQCSATAVAKFTIAGPVIWFVDPAAASNGVGTLTSPFNVLSAADAVDAANHRIFVYNGTTTTGLTMLSGEWLVGQSATGPFDTVFALTPPSGTTARPTMGAGTTIIGGTVTLAATAKVQGVAINTGVAAGLVGSGPISGVSVSESSVTTTTGTAISLNNATGTYTFSSVSTTGAANGVLIDNLGTSVVTINGGSITGATSRGVDINSGSGDFTFGGTITTSAAGRSVEVSSRSGGTLAFNGNVNDSGLGINLSSNTGATINFSGGVIVSSGANAAFTVTGGGTVGVTGTTNTLATTTGTALNVANTTISANGLNFRSITAGTAASGPVNGIVLDSTGASGGLTVQGTGSAGSGGTIQNTSGAGIVLASTRGVSLTRMEIRNTTGSGIDGTQVVNFSLTNTEINGSGSIAVGGTSNVAFNDLVAGTGSNLAGAVVISDNNFTNAAWHGVDILNFSGNITSLDVSNNIITSSTSAAVSLGSGIRVQTLGSAGSAAGLGSTTISTNTINNFPSGGGVLVLGGNSASLVAPAANMSSVTINANSISGQSAVARMGTNAILATTSGVGSGSFTIANNTLSHTTGTTIGFGADGIANGTFAITGNTINSNNQFSSSGIGGGVGVVFAGGNAATANVNIAGNIITNTNGTGILAVARAGAGQLSVKINNNSVTAPTAGFGDGIRVDAGNTASTDDAVCLEITGNTTAGVGGGSGIALRKQGTVATTNDFAIEGLVGSFSPAIENLVNSLNPGSTGTGLVSAASGFSSCILP